ncbi:hypothetical protein PR003_g13565 [Phytophthora rubi]|uniref:Uncharacterized protein n=1 Tax=Phytophthora rubi TaxID=129364 RepID=A0A6A3JQZ9_9STRA|nr:hypothetical protein PR002_g19359 [Phytophthora rubi]KAE9022941.1 hypothetical protein PR001_g13029 [Phytophthora rubi]KAE9334343.1 hypothetical protein PR003_g13565 [Phytophthora rubi]
MTGAQNVVSGVGVPGVEAWPGAPGAGAWIQFLSGSRICTRSQHQVGHGRNILREEFPEIQQVSVVELFHLDQRLHATIPISGVDMAEQMIISSGDAYQPGTSEGRKIHQDVVTRRNQHLVGWTKLRGRQHIVRLQASRFLFCQEASRMASAICVPTSVPAVSPSPDVFPDGGCTEAAGGFEAANLGTL